MVNFTEQIMLVSAAFAVILDLSSSTVIRKGKLSEWEDEDWRKDFDRTADPLNRNRHTVIPIDSDEKIIDGIDWEEKPGTGIPDWIKMFSKPPFEKDKDKDNDNGRYIIDEDKDIDNGRYIIDEDKDIDNGRYIIDEDNYPPKKSDNSTPIILLVLIPVLALLFVAFIIKCVIKSYKSEIQNRPLHLPPVTVYPQTRMEQTLPQSATGWTPPSNETPNSSDVSDKPPCYSEVVISDVSASPLSFPDVQMNKPDQESPPPIYDEQKMWIF